MTSTIEQSPIVTETKFEISSSPWYGKLVWLQYFLSAVVAADVLRKYPAGFGFYASGESWWIPLEVLHYTVILVFNFAIAFISTLVFMDEDLQWFRRKSEFGALTSKSYCSKIIWSLCILALVAASATFDFVKHSWG